MILCADRDNFSPHILSPFEDTAEITSDIIPDTDDPDPDVGPPKINKTDGKNTEEYDTVIKTGNTTDQGFWVAVMLISFTVCILTVVLEKKETKQRKS